MASMAHQKGEPDSQSFSRHRVAAAVINSKEETHRAVTIANRETRWLPFRRALAKLEFNNFFCLRGIERNSRALRRGHQCIRFVRIW